MKKLKKIKPTTNKTCEAASFGGLCGYPATYRGMITGLPLCYAHATMRVRQDSEAVKPIE